MYICNLSIALQPLQYGAFSKNYCGIHFEITSGKLWTPTMQMRFSRQITLSLSPIPFINVMISKTIFNLLSIAINIILFAIIGPFSDILYTVGGGMGVCLTCVYCQQKNIITGNMHNRTLIDARQSLADTVLEENVAVIKFLSEYDFC